MWILAVVIYFPFMQQGIVMAQDSLGSIERLTPEFDGLVAANSKIEILASGFTWTEGPVWMDDHLLFSDIPRNSIFKWDPQTGISLFMTPSGYTGVTYYGLEPGSNGLLRDKQGRLMMCEHGDRRISVLTNQGGKKTIVDSYDGKRLNSPNDAALKSNGDVYFTDPPYGLPERFTDPRRELDYCGVYRVAADGKVTLLTKTIERPNGIAFSPDEKTLYVAQSNPDQANWTAFPVLANGTLGEGRELYNVTERVTKEPGLPDGMTVDANGILWCSGPGGIYVFNPQGQLLGRLVTGERTSNCTLAPDGYLYITADTYLCRVKTSAKPALH
ncbi:MAG: SMP-30/gluconolactonase/LRE family protein [Planctomycetales bacterium]|nr:SMP-30/gluconolactonase/LRE family protein [Planctomycetales bacterium]